MSKKKNDEPAKLKSKKSPKKSSAEITVDGVAAASVQSLAPPKQRSAVGKKRTAARFELSSDDIARRAYYISERRRNLNLEGDELGDWVEAERQLRKEVLEKSS